MRIKEVAFAVLCVLAGGLAGYALTRAGETLLPPAVYFTTAIVVLGAALVLVRYDRLGPFEGELGPPRHEGAIREEILREARRALRYGGEFAVLVVQRRSDTAMTWHRVVRGSDAIIYCRKRQTVILLPQTGRESATQTAARLDAAAGEPIGIAMIHFPSDGVSAEDLCPTLLQLMKRFSSPGEIQLARSRPSSTIPLSAQAPPSA